MGSCSGGFTQPVRECAHMGDFLAPNLLRSHLENVTPLAGGLLEEEVKDFSITLSFFSPFIYKWFPKTLQVIKGGGGTNSTAEQSSLLCSFVCLIETLD